MNGLQYCIVYYFLIIQMLFLTIQVEGVFFCLKEHFDHFWTLMIFTVFIIKPQLFKPYKDDQSQYKSFLHCKKKHGVYCF